MARNSSQSVYRPNDEPSELVAKTLATILGIPRAQVPIRRDQLLRNLPTSDIAVLARQVARRFIRVVDPVTSQVRFERMGPAITVDIDQLRDPIFARETRLYIDGARELLREIDPVRCRAGVCADEIRELLTHISITFDVLVAQFGSNPAPEIVQNAFADLTDRNGLFPRLRTLITSNSRSHGGANRFEEQQIEILDTADGLLTGLKRLWERKNNAAPSTNTMFIAASQYASAITEQVITVRAVLAELGVSNSELELSSTNLAEFLSAAETEPLRWKQLSELGGIAQIESIRRSVTKLEQLADIKINKVVQRFGIPGKSDEGSQLRLSLNRLRRTVISAYQKLTGGSHHSPASEVQLSERTHGNTTDQPSRDASPSPGGTRPPPVDLATIVGMEANERAMVDPQSCMASARLEELRRICGATVRIIDLTRDRNSLSPEDDLVLEAGDILTLVGTATEVDRVMYEAELTDPSASQMMTTRGDANSAVGTDEITIQLRVDQSSPMERQTLEVLRSVCRDTVRIIDLTRDRNSLSPEDDLVLEAGDILTLVGTATEVNRVMYEAELVRPDESDTGPLGRP